MCDNCKGISEPCEECRALVRTTASRKNNAKRCARCSKSFKKLQTTKSRTIKVQRTFDDLRHELSRPSEYRDNATRTGNLRSFLHLVSLTGVARLQIAINLGWTLVTEPEYGNPHAEAWDIISRKGVGLQDRCMKWRQRWNPWAKASNWYDILERVCKEMCVPTYMSWEEEFASPRLSKSEAMAECMSPISRPLADLEMEFLTKLSKHQRSRMTSLQVCCLAELRNSEPVRRLMSLACLQSTVCQALVTYALDGAYITLARRDGSDGTGSVMPEALAAEVAAFLCGVAAGDDSTIFHEFLHPEPKDIPEAGTILAHKYTLERDTPPPGSILNSNAQFFWLTIDMLDVEFCSDVGRMLPACLQMILNRGRLAIHGLSVEDFAQSVSGGRGPHGDM
jgi:hypothetical protein